MHPSLECSLMWKDWSSLSPGLCGHNLNSAKPGVQLPGLKWDFFFLVLAVKEQLYLLLPPTIQLEGVGTASLVVC